MLLKFVSQKHLQPAYFSFSKILGGIRLFLLFRKDASNHESVCMKVFREDASNHESVCMKLFREDASNHESVCMKVFKEDASNHESEAFIRKQLHHKGHLAKCRTA